MNELGRLRESVARHLGLGLEEVRDAELRAILERRMEAHGVKKPAVYLALLDGPTGKTEAKALGELLTVGETYFFRGARQFRVLRERVLPSFWRQDSEVRVLSAGCSSGEEPYSLAMMFFDEGWDGVRRRVRIDAVDLDRRALAKAAAGVYSRWSLRETSPALQRRWFSASGNDFRVVPEILASVRFHNDNVLELAKLFAPDTFDLVLCRNVLMYLTPASTRAVVDQLTELVVPGGYLFVSEAESLRGITDAFELVGDEDVFYYRRPLAPPPVAPVVAPREPVPAPPPPPPSPPCEDVFPLALELFARERFAEALTALDAVAVPVERAEERAIYRAVALLGAGAIDEAEALARDVVVEGARPADAHMVVALAAEHRHDASTAREHYHAALYLDPNFALARLYLGRIDRREDRLADAARELRQAQALLADEEPARLALFGGGFSREGLAALCKSERALVEKVQ